MAQVFVDSSERYNLLPQPVFDLTIEVDANDIISVVQLQQEDKKYCLSNYYLELAKDLSYCR